MTGSRVASGEDEGLRRPILVGHLLSLSLFKGPEGERVIKILLCRREKGNSSTLRLLFYFIFTEHEKKILYVDCYVAVHREKAEWK